MTSIDQKDIEVQQHFTSMKKTISIGEKKELASQLAKMYEKNDDYSDGVWSPFKIDFQTGFSICFWIQWSRRKESGVDGAGECRIQNARYCSVGICQ